MTRGQLPKAFLRVDPDIDQKHPDNLDGFIRLLCAANRQRVPGVFRSRDQLDRLLGKRAVDLLVRDRDVEVLPGGTLRVVAWDAQPRRPRLGVRLWQVVLERFSGRCAYCGTSTAALEQDHRIPFSKGGPTDESNIVPACVSCNRRKRDSDPDGWPLLEAGR